MNTCLSDFVMVLSQWPGRQAVIYREGRATASYNFNRIGKYYYFLFHFKCWRSLSPFPKMPHSLTNVIASMPE